ncbi:MAG: hypothetical protein ABL927_12655, partial [Bdellovibrionales bacterium]
MSKINSKLTRRDLLRFSGFLGASLLFAACGADSDLPKPPTNFTQGNGTCDTGATTFYTNPGHAHMIINLSIEQITATQPGEYVLLNGRHSHSFNLTIEDFENIKNKLIVRKEDNEGHGHI